MGETIATIIPHASHGDPKCCGCLVVLIDQRNARIVCNEFGALVRLVPSAGLARVLQEMELAGDVAMEVCPHCHGVNIFPGFATMIAFVCQHCGASVKAE